jgi:hypothetical protein
MSTTETNQTTNMIYATLHLEYLNTTIATPSSRIATYAADVPERGRTVVTISNQAYEQIGRPSDIQVTIQAL